MSLPTKFKLYRRMWDLIDIVFPPECSGCKTRGSKWCSTCHAGIKKLNSPLCQICGTEIKSSIRICPECTENEPEFNSLRSYGYFNGPLRNAIHGLKYRRDIGMGLVFAEMLNSLFDFTVIDFNIVIPVPLSKARFAQRGYNQAAIIAYPFSISSELRYSSHALVRIRNTRSQIELSRDERKLNVKNAFWANEKIVKNKSILLIDDVVTTGSTLNSCAAALLSAGAKQVHCLTVARAETIQIKVS